MNILIVKMPVFCVVDGCKSSTNINKKKDSEHIKFLTFPKNCEVRKLWIEACGVKNVNANSGRICSLHFTEQDWRLRDILLKTPITKRFLKPNAVPSIMMPEKAKTNQLLQDQDKIEQPIGIPKN